MTNSCMEGSSHFQVQVQLDPPHSVPDLHTGQMLEIFCQLIQKSPRTRHMVYFWKVLGTRNSMAMSWGVRHANTQRQRQRQRQIHLGPEVESHYRPYMCYIFGKPWVQGPLLHCSPPPHTIYYDTVPPPQDDFQARRALGSRRPHSNRVSTSACDTRLNCIGPKCICLCICLYLLYLHV